MDEHVLSNKNGKNKKVFIIMLITLIIIAFLVILYMFLLKKEFKFNENNFSVNMIEYIYGDDINDLDDGEQLYLEVDGNNIHQKDRFNEYYMVDDNIVSSLKSEKDDSIIWYNLEDKGNLSIDEYIKEINDNKQISIDIVNELKDANYKKNDDVYVIKLNSDKKTKIINILKEKFLESDLDVCSYYDDGWQDCIKKYEIKNVILENNDNDKEISKITITLSKLTYDSEGNFIKDLSYSEYDEITIVLNFSNFGTTNVKLTDDIITSLEKIKAGDFVGQYTHKGVCSNGQTYEESIELTDDFDFVFGYGWEVKEYMSFDCNTGQYYYVLHSGKYDIDNNIITFYNQGEEVTKFKYDNNKLSELDDDNNVVTVFDKK